MNREILRIYWEQGQKGFMYFNGGKNIPFREAMKNASKGKYQEVIDDWKGPMPVDLWMKMRSTKKDLERFIAHEYE